MTFKKVSTKICFFEFFGDYFIDDENGSILSNLGNLK